MSRNTDVVLQVGQELDGLVVRRAEPVEEFRCIAYELEHPATGARILHLHNDDAENLFSVVLPTPPPDDTGVPHILEHCVLGGSRKYTVKDPFFEMIKCSMATFINAMTSTDHTLYPVASNVKQDYYNLADLYWDAVFHPRLTEPTFAREGHHLEFAEKGNPASDLVIKGIVYNEMKGARSSPETLVYDFMEKGLWPDTPYGKDSGGDPAFIPQLTYQQFKRFHQTYYHPSNAYIFLYGDISTAEHVKFLAPRLNEFRRQKVDANLPFQPRWSSPRRQTHPYPVGPSDPLTAKTFLVVNWITGDGADLQDVLAMSALDLILLGHQGAPLRKALIDSHLGEDLTHSGFGVNGRESSFHIGLKASEADRAEAFEKLVFETLRQIVATGVSREQADAAFQQLAYRNLEIVSLFPLHLMRRATHLWMLQQDPLATLRAAKDLESLKGKFADDPHIFSRLIQERLIDNPHRLTLIVRPDREIQGRKDQEQAAKMRELKASLSKGELEQVAQKQEQLEELANTPNSPELLATLPQLQVRDLPRKPRHIPTSVDQSEGLTLLRNDVFANGVNYLQVRFDLSNLPAELFPFLPLYSDCVTKMGAAGLDYAAMAGRVAAHTGGVGFGHAADSRVDEPATVYSAVFSTKFLDSKTAPALDILRDVIFALDCTDRPRLSDVLRQVRAYHRSRPASDGLGLAARHAGRGFTLEGYLSELWHGLPQTRLVENLASGNHDALIEKFQAIGRYLTQSGGLMASFTGTDHVYEKLKTTLRGWSARTAGPAPRGARLNFEPWLSSPREGLAAPMDVAYCVTTLPAIHISQPDAMLLAVGSRLVSFGHVLEEVRFKGTAYGGGCGYDGQGRTWTFHSYRDPFINRTLDVYRAAVDFVHKADWSQTEVDRAIIGTAKQFERPIRPGEATGAALGRYLLGDTRERREARHAAMLGVTASEVKRAVLEALERGFLKSAVCVVSSRQKLEAANKERPHDALPIEDILPAENT
jgi:presequence protease